MRFKWALAGLAFTLALPVSTAMAGAFEDGVTAYERQDYATALGLFQPLADKGDASAQFNIGSMYAYGEGVPQNFAEAGRWFRRAADQGHATAQFNLGAMYAEGLGLAQDYPEAARWYRKAADQGDAITQFNLGLMYAEGQGLPRDHAESGKWFRKAADQGDANAQANLGVMIGRRQLRFRHLMQRQPDGAFVLVQRGGDCGGGCLPSHSRQTLAANSFEQLAASWLRS